MGKKSEAAHRAAAGIVMPFHLKPSSVVVFEGLDGTGKTTQQERFERACYAPTTGTAMFDGDPMFLHMPSGTNELGSKIYELTETDAPLTPLTRQLLHLACHATEMPETIVPALERGQSVFLDRFWWSTVAYGWKGVEASFSRRALADLAERVWNDLPEPDLICLFMDPHVEDRHNTPSVRRGYEWLAGRFATNENVVMVPKDDEAHQTMFILDAMASRGIYRNGV